MPVPTAYWPDRQLEHAPVAPDAAVYLPCAQMVQLIAPVLKPVVPAEHVEQLAAPVVAA